MEFGQKLCAKVSGLAFNQIHRHRRGTRRFQPAGRANVPCLEFRVETAILSAMIVTKL